MLETFYTDFYAGNSVLFNSLRKPIFYHNLPSLFKKGLDRYEPKLEKAKISHFPLLAYQFAQQRKNSSVEKRQGFLIKVAQKFCNRIIKNGLGDANVIYGFNGASLELFEFAKKSSFLSVIFDQQSCSLH